MVVGTRVAIAGQGNQEQHFGSKRWHNECCKSGESGRINLENLRYRGCYGVVEGGGGGGWLPFVVGFKGADNSGIGKSRWVDGCAGGGVEEVV